MSEHTKGPWKWVSDEVRSFDGTAICQVYAVDADDTKRGRLVADANHRLLAAAPDLLAALERTAHALEMAFSRKPLRDMAETLAEAKSVIAKARAQ